ncbi:L-glyceraldehyde 3-phosphate reductase [Kribbella turkmenica]|uniref:L-glyceraldehyde 3-phosphate reductase n=1 Tax=Kribbella turkmenica TaxID=2530375 RepID=A0A4R4XF99_9ACTN|nr:L-glyceraldehyde 3-phosphate reductase [Kribbella turkmenica]TDD29219.1 L-glyceraldehyde 3-phosphate reductase [Kribbella turkmenica]
MTYIADPDRYEGTKYSRAGSSGLQLPKISLGLWQNFGAGHSYGSQKDTILAAFDAGITHFDLANNYGPPPGESEISFGRVLREELSAHRNEIVVATKAGYRMWPGPYGEWGSRKYMLASLDESLERLGLDYVDIYYSHRFDPDTPLEETIGALQTAVTSGRALYVGISSYSAARTREAFQIAHRMGLRLLVHQPNYSMLNRWIEVELLDTLDELGMGCVAFSPLAQGLLTGKYLDGVPSDSRASSGGPFKAHMLDPKILQSVKALNAIAAARGTTLAQMAIAWCLRDRRVTSVVLGASSPKQLLENLAALNEPEFSDEELAQIDAAAFDADVDLWLDSRQS